MTFDLTVNGVLFRWHRLGKSVAMWDNEYRDPTGRIKGSLRKNYITYWVSVDDIVCPKRFRSMQSALDWGLRHLHVLEIAKKYGLE